MTITTTWSIDDLEYDPSDGFVKNAYWKLEGKNGVPFFVMTKLSM